MGLVEKFGAEQSRDHHGDHLTWPGTDAGFPILGRVSGTMKQQEFEELEHKFTYHARWFVMWEAADAHEYLYVQERAVNGWFKVLDREKIYDPVKRNYRIYLEWIQVYGVAPREPTDALQKLLLQSHGDNLDLTG